MRLQPLFAEIHSAVARFGGVPRKVVAMMAMTALFAGCNFNHEDLIVWRSQVEEREVHYPIATSQAWVNAPAMRSAMQRDLRSTAEQQLSLVNHTLVPGDNLLLLRTRSRMEIMSRFQFEEFVTRIGGALPYPFSELKAGDLVQDSDALGDYFWAEQRMDGATVCVLGMRRLDSSMRQMPLDASLLDVMLRNCVVGSTDEALAPLLADSIGIVPMAGGPSGESRMLSPLAAPTAGARRYRE